MKKIIILGVNNRFLNNTNKWLYYFMGLMFLIMGSGHIYRDYFGVVGIGTILGVMMILAAVFEFIYGYITFSKSSKYAPRVVINENEIELKNSHFKPNIQVKWNDIKKIEFGAYLIIFQLFDEKVLFTFESSPGTSIEIKEIIRTMAEKKGVEVING